MATRKTEIHEIYQELDSYIKLSQEEIESLYEQEGITEKSYAYQLRELKEQLEKETSLSAEEKLLRAIYKDPEEDKRIDRIAELKEKIEDLEKKTARTEDQLLLATTKRYRSSRKYPSLALRNQIFQGTVGLAHYFARVYFYKVKQQYRFDYDDLFQIACEGLLSACHYYVIGGTASFKTYASKCIENRIKREIRLSKRKRKKQVNLEIELDRMHILKSFLEKEVFRGSGKIFELEDLLKNPSVTLYRLNQKILDHNQEVLNLGETERVWNKTYRKKDRENAFEKVQEIFQVFERYLREGQIENLITDEDRELVYLISQKKNYKQSDISAFILFEYLETYIMRLYQVDTYLKTEKRLLEENAGILPEESVILKEINRSIRETNQMLKERRYRLWGNGSLEKRTSFLQEYIKKFDVNFVDQDEREDYLERFSYRYEDYWNGSAIPKNDNYDDDDFYDWGELYTDDFLGRLTSEDILDFIETLEDGRNHLKKDYDRAQKENLNRVVFRRDLNLLHENNGESRICISGYTFQEGPDGYTLEEAFDILSEEIESMKVMVSNYNEIEEELNKRKEEVKEIVKEKNEGIFSRNQQLKDKLTLSHVLQDCNRQRLKKWDTRTLEEIKNYVQLIYCDDETLMGLAERKIDSKRGPERSVEEEVILQEFLDDYKKALESLPLVQRKIWDRWYDEDGIHSVSAKELAQELGISERKVYAEKEKGKVLLKQNEVLRSYLEEEN